MSNARRLALAALTVLAALAVAGTAGARALGQSEGDQIVLSGVVEVPRGTIVGEIVVLHGRAVVSGVARGDVVVFDGAIEVSGQVSGSVIAVNGRVSVGKDAQIRGDVIARRDVAVEPGARIDGAVRERVAFMWRTPVDVFGRFSTWFAVTASTLALGFLVILIAPRGADAISAAARTAPLACLGWGVGLAVGVPVLAVLAVASIVGLPLGLVVALALAFLAFLGYALSAFAIGRLLWRPPRSRALAFLFGWAVVRAAGAVPYVSGITLAVGAAFGLGTTAVATWRARATGGKHREGRTVQLSEPMREEAGL